MKPIFRFGLLSACISLSGCAGYSNNSTTTTAAPTAVAHSDIMRVGDKITVRLTGVPSDTDAYIVELQIPQSGDVTVPLLSQPFHAAGRNAGDLAADISEAYKAQRIYSTPDVTVIPEERFVSVGGDVRSPTSVLYRPDLTLLGAVNACGGFTDYAQRRSVRIIRGQQVIYVDAAAAARTAGADPALFPGDQVYVPRTMF